MTGFKYFLNDFKTIKNVKHVPNSHSFHFMTFYRPEIYKINCLSLLEHSFVQLLDVLLQFQDDKLQQLSHICT